MSSGRQARRDVEALSEDRQAELVDVHPHEPLPGFDDVLETGRRGLGWSRWPRWSWLALVVSLGLVTGLVVARAVRSHPAHPGAGSNAVGITSRAPQPVAVLVSGRRLLGITARWDLFGLGPGVVVRIQPASGRLTITRLPGPAAVAPEALVALPGRVIIRPAAYPDGYSVADGKPAIRLNGPLARPGPVEPGPGAGQTWVRTSPANQDATRMTPIGSSGRVAGASVQIPGDGYLSGDGTGHILYTTRVDDVYYVTSPGRWQVHTTGQVLAAGANRVVTDERERPSRYVTVVTDVRNGSRRVYPSRGFVADPVLGTVAPDGRTAAILSGDSAATSLRLLDLTSGIERGPATALAGNAESLAWSPDGRWLFATVVSGDVVALDTRTGAVHELGLALPPLTQLAVRPAP